MTEKSGPYLFIYLFLNIYFTLWANNKLLFLLFISLNSPPSQHRKFISAILAKHFYIKFIVTIIGSVDRNVDTQIVNLFFFPLIY